MTRKHFDLIANVIAGRVAATHPNNGNRQDELRLVARDFAASLRLTNPNFNAERFLKACGVED